MSGQRPKAAGSERAYYRSRDDVIRAILSREAAGGRLRPRDMTGQDRFLAHAAVRHFGNWRNALAAAGIDGEAVTGCRRWTVERVIRRIRQLDVQGVALNHASVRKTDHGLLAAAIRQTQRGKGREQGSR